MKYNLNLFISSRLNAVFYGLSDDHLMAGSLGLVRLNPHLFHSASASAQPTDCDGRQSLTTAKIHNYKPSKMNGFGRHSLIYAEYWLDLFGIQFGIHHRKEERRGEWHGIA